MTKLENYLEDGANYRCKCCKEEIVEGLKKQREKAKDIMSKAELLHENLANCHPSIARGKVWCRTCGREKHQAKCRAQPEPKGKKALLCLLIKRLF
jgi:hypothetical protein